MKYKVGDKVRVRGDLKEGKTYGSDSFVVNMMQQRGKVVTITWVNEDKNKYSIDADFYWWTDEMFEPVCEVGDFCTGFRGGKIPTPEKPVTIEETAEYYRQQLISNCGVPPMFFSNRSAGKRAALDRKSTRLNSSHS